MHRVFRRMLEEIREEYGTGEQRDHAIWSKVRTDKYSVAEAADYFLVSEGTIRRSLARSESGPKAFSPISEPLRYDHNTGRLQPMDRRIGSDGSVISPPFGERYY